MNINSHGKLCKGLKMLAVSTFLLSNMTMAQSGYFANMTGQKITSQNISELNGAQAFTLEGDFYAETLKTWTNLLNQQESSTKRVQLMAHEGVVYALVADGYNTWVRTSTAVLKANEWTHVAMTFSSGDIKIFVNGEQKPTEQSGNFLNVPVVAPNTTASFSVGATKYEGNMDNIRVWSTPLSVSLLSQWQDKTVTSAHPKSSNLVLNWDFEDYSTSNLVSSAASPAQSAAYSGNVSNLEYKRQYVTSYIPHKRVNAIENSGNGPGIASRLTHMLYFSITADSNGDLGRLGAVDSTGFYPLVPLDTITTIPTDISKIKGWIGSRNVKLFVTFGGGKESRYLEFAMNTEAKRQKIADGLKDFAVAYGLGGIDVNWENNFGGALNLTHYEDFLAKLRANFAGTDLKLSVAINHSHADFADVLEQYTDFAQVMTYDYVEGGATGTHYPISKLKTTVDDFLSHGISHEKLIFGMPMYSRSKHVDAPDDAVTYAGLVKRVPSMTTADDWVWYNGYRQYYNGVDTIIEKSEHAKLLGLGGVMFWESGQDISPTDPMSLLNAASSSIGVNSN